MSNISRQFSQHMFRYLDSDTSVVGGNRYFIALGKSEDWTTTSVPEPDNSLKGQKDFRNRMQSLKRVTDTSFVVPKVDWVYGTRYNPWNDTDENLENFYVVNQYDEVFVCIYNLVSPLGTYAQSIVEPTAADQALVHPHNPARSYKTADGYIWRFLYKISPLAKARYQTSAWIPVKTIRSDTPFVPEEIQQKALQDSAINGEIIGVQVLSRGDGYSSPPTITPSPLSSLSSFTGFITSSVNGQVFDVTLDSNGSGLILHDSSQGQFTVKSTGNCVLRAIQAPFGGLNADPVVTLKSKHMMFRADIQGNEPSGGQDAIETLANYKQFGLLLNPLNYNSTTRFSGNAGTASRSFTLSSVGSILEDDKITQGATAEALVSYVDAGGKIHYYQSDSTGYEPFTTGSITYQTNLSTTITAINNPDIDVQSGKLLSVQNVQNLPGNTRSTSQTDDVRIIINIQDCE